MPRICPNDGSALVAEKMAGEEIDRCPECRGTYFDAGELPAVMGMARCLQSIELQEPEIETVSTAERERVMLCPADGTWMTAHDFAMTTVDVCDQCRGVWLDDGELTALRIANASIRENLQLYIRLGE